MKKIIILAACIIAMHAASAQVSMVRQQAHNIDNLETIIRNYNGNSTVTCTNMKNGTAVFIYNTPPSSQTYEYSLKGYYINDMVCFKDTVFFCGYKNYNDNTCGILGFFKISEAFFTGGSQKIFIQDTLYAGIDMKIVKKLTRLVTYIGNDGATRHVVCIGNCIENYPCVIDFKPDFGGNYTGGYVNSSYETFCDIKLVTEYQYEQIRSYLATAGFETTLGDYINLRLYDIDNVVTNPGIQNYINVIASDTSSVREWYMDGVLLTPVSNNNIATVSYRYHNNTNDGLANLNVSVFDVHKLVTGSLFPMVHNLEIYLGDTIYNRKLHHAIYRSPSQTLAFLHTLRNSGIGYENSFFYEIDYTNITNPGTPRKYSHPDHLLQGMDNYNGTSQYVMSGFRKSLISILRYEFEKFTQPPYCVSDLGCSALEKTLVFSARTERQFNSRSFHSYLKKIGNDYFKYPITTQCPE